MFRLWLHILSWGYGAVVALRRVLYKKKIKKSVCYTHPKIIGIGNLSLGGTGKTPLVIYLAKWLSKHQSIALLSRGYKRKSTGFRVVSESESAVTVGDEPYLLYKNFIDNPNVVVAICENRAQGVEKIMAYRPNVEVVLLDDAFQHLSLTPHVHILLTPFHQPFFKDHLLPLGRLREPRRGASRADTIVVTKSPPNLTASNMQAIQAAIQRYHTKEASIFFSYIIYHDPVRVTTHKKHKLPTTLLLVTGIADPRPLHLYLEKRGHKVKHLAFTDHHWFNDTDIIKISHLFHALDDSDKAILITEKDYVRLIDNDLIKLLAPLPVYYMAIEVAFHQADKALFEQKIMERLNF